ncbi:hypothetical protein ACTFIU_006947 [Dictyostelium citrinum]
MFSYKSIIDAQEIDKLSDGYLAWFAAKIIEYDPRTEKYLVEYTGYPGFHKLGEERIKFRRDIEITVKNIEVGLKVIAAVFPSGQKSPFWYTAHIQSFDNFNFLVRFENGATKRYSFQKRKQSFIF